MLFFEIVSLITLAILAFRLGLYREKTKPVKLFFTLALYAVMAIVSTMGSANGKASLTGNFYQFQGVLVLIGYVLFCFYTYQILEREQDYKVIWYGICVWVFLMMLCGLFQIFQHDLMNYRWIQRLVMSAEQYERYGGEIETVFTWNNVFLTLFNPNYAGIYLAMMVCVFGVMWYCESQKKEDSTGNFVPDIVDSYVVYVFKINTGWHPDCGDSVLLSDRKTQKKDCLCVCRFWIRTWWK